MYGGPQNLNKLFTIWPFTESLLTLENVIKETREVAEENTGEPREGEVFPNDTKSRNKRKKKTDKFENIKLKTYM